MKNFNESGIGNNLHDSLEFLGIEVGATVWKVKIRYRTLARRLNPDKHDPNITGLTSEEEVELFKLVNNVQQFLCTTFTQLLVLDIPLGNLTQALSLIW